MRRGPGSTVALALMLASAGGCRSSEPAVEVQSYVGPRHRREDPEARREQAVAVAHAVLAELRAAPSTPRATAPERAPLLHPPEDAEQFERLVQSVREAPVDELDGPARRLAAAGPAVWPQIRAALLADRATPKGDYRSLLSAIGGDVPNRYGHFALAWKKAHGHAVRLSEDWFEDLLSVPIARISSGLRAVHRDCILQTALLRAAAAIGADHPALTGEVVSTLLDVAYLHQGTFRDEVGRSLVAVGDEGIPHLLVESMPPPGRRRARDREDPEALRAEYARVHLDKMDRLHPQRAVDAAREHPRRLTRILHAYGTARPGEAAAVLLEFVDAVDPAVRAAARAAFTAYVDGPPPPTKGRTIRLLGGGTGRALSHLSFRHRAAIAIRERIEAEIPALLEPACELQREDGSLDRACEDQPRRLTEAYFGWLARRRADADRRAVDDAMAEPDVRRRVQRLDRLLAANPRLDLGDRLVPVYREAAALAMTDRDPARAGQLLRKAARLTEPADADLGRALRVQALLAEASVPRLTPPGRAMLLASARELAPDDPRIAGALAELQRPSTGPSLATRRRWAPVGGMLAGLWGLGVIGAWWRRRRARG